VVPPASLRDSLPLPRHPTSWRHKLQPLVCLTEKKAVASLAGVTFQRLPPRAARRPGDGVAQSSTAKGQAPSSRESPRDRPTQLPRTPGKPIRRETKAAGARGNASRRGVGRTSSVCAGWPFFRSGSTPASCKRHPPNERPPAAFAAWFWRTRGEASDGLLPQLDNFLAKLIKCD
jgi:hypothetical protein